MRGAPFLKANAPISRQVYFKESKQKTTRHLDSFGKILLSLLSVGYSKVDTLNIAIVTLKIRTFFKLKLFVLV